MQEETRILHSIPVDELTGAVSTPIYQTSTFVQEAPGIHKGYDYARSNNPTRAVLENLIAKLENGHSGFAFGSGLAAIDAVIKLLKAGDEVIAVDDIYGGAFRLFTHIYKKFGINVKYVDTTDPENIINAITGSTRLIWLETPTNPTLKISDISTIARISKNKNILLCVDNTFASPASQKPITLGADIVVHSATKYLSGHSDLIAGLVVTANENLSSRIKFIQNASGAILGPFDSWLTIRGMETLFLRVQKHSENAGLIAEYLKSNNSVNRVHYPGLKSHPGYSIAQNQMRFGGGVVTFDLAENDAETARRFIAGLKYFKLAESLGGVKSLVCIPAEMTHKSIPAQIRQNAGITDSLIRLSVGLEDPEDLISDLENAFKLLKLKPQYN